MSATKLEKMLCIAASVAARLVKLCLRRVQTHRDGGRSTIHPERCQCGDQSGIDSRIGLQGSVRIAQTARHTLYLEQ